AGEHLGRVRLLEARAAGRLVLADPALEVRRKLGTRARRRRVLLVDGADERVVGLWRPDYVDVAGTRLAGERADLCALRAADPLVGLGPLLGGGRAILLLLDRRAQVRGRHDRCIGGDVVALPERDDRRAEDEVQIGRAGLVDLCHGGDALEVDDGLAAPGVLQPEARIDAGLALCKRRRGELRDRRARGRRNVVLLVD